MSSLMILLDTHVWVWWAADDVRLSDHNRRTIDAREADGVAVSVFSFWEVAMLASKGRVDLGGEGVQAWFDRVLAVPTLHVIPVSPQLLLDSTTLPEGFHSDPADRIIVATAVSYQMPLLTEDQKILGYEPVRTIGPTA